jgi:hypothetical protein
MSSTNRRWVILYLEAIKIPIRFPKWTSWFIARLRHSTTRRKRRGESGQPYLRPRSEWKKGAVAPFISKVKEIEFRQAMIHLIKGTSKPK